MRAALGSRSRAFYVAAFGTRSMVTQSTLTISAPTIVEGDPAVTITVTARDANNAPLAGLAVVLSATGTGNTLNQPGAVTNGSGVATGDLTSTDAGSKIISATIDGTPINARATLIVTAAGTGNMWEDIWTDIWADIWAAA